MAEALIGGSGMPVPALGGARSEGFAAVDELPIRAMLAVRGDLGSQAVHDAVRAAAGTDLPDRLSLVRDGEALTCWMSPDELLSILPWDRRADALEALSSTLGDDALVADVSDMRSAFRVSGPASRDVLAKLVPLDLSPDAFGPHAFRRTRLGQVAAALWTDADGRGFDVVCMRSQARYAFDLLSNAARHGEVGFHR